MRLTSVARRFDRMWCFDGYTGDPLFRAQLGLFDDSKRDSEAAERRIVSVGPGLDWPARRVAYFAGTRWIIGKGNPDTFLNDMSRIGYVAHEATYLSQVRTLAQVCLNQPGLTAYAGRAWVKNMAFTEQSSKLTPQFHIHYAVDEPVLENQIVSFDGQLNMVRSVEKGPGGTLIATVEQLAEPAVEDVSIVNGEFNPITETIVGSPSAVRVVRFRWQSLFRYRNDITPAFGPGDLQLAIAKSVMTVEPGAQLTMSDGTWTVKSAVDQGDVWLCKASLHG